MTPSSDNEFATKKYVDDNAGSGGGGGGSGATNTANNMFSKGTFLHSTDTTWSPRGEILGKDSYDYFGWSVSVNGDGTIIAAAAPNNSDGHSSAGAIRIYKWNDVDLSWNKMGSDIYGETANEQSGGSGGGSDVTQHPISLNKAGSIVAIGSYLNDVNGSNRGLVRMFKWNDTSWNQLGQNIYGEANEDQSGHSVRMNGIGDIVIIGAIYNDGAGVNSGHARIYQYNDVSWNQIGQDIDGDSNGDNLGWSTSINETGSIIAVSAIYNDAGGSNSGNVRVYEYNDTSWNKLGQDIYGDGAGDESGYSVSLNGSGKIVAIGARYNDGGGSNSGHARVYEYNDVSWNQIGQNINGKYTNEYLGWCISIDSTGSILAIGEGDSSLDGMIVIYNWNQTTELWDFNERLYSYQSDDRFGRSVALSSDGTTLIAGAPYFISNGSYKGLVRMYHSPNKLTEDSFHINALTDISGMLNVKGSFKVDISGGGLENTYNPSKLVEATTATNILFWKQKGNTVIGKLNGTSGSQYWGRYEHSIAMNETGDTFVVGNHENDEGTSGNNAGITQIYRWNDVSWSQIGQNIYGEANDDQSGWATTINGEGNIVVIGARYNDDGGSSSGHVRVYQYNDVSWNKMGLDIHGESNDDRFGYSVSINKKGNIIAAGGYLDDGGTGGGSNHGHVRIYEWDESNETWNQLGDSISGYKNHDEMGRSVSLNTDGTIVAIQHRANQTASDRGRITAHQWDGTAWNQLGDNTQMKEINNSNQGVTGSSDILKTVISGDGTIIVVGSEFNDDGGTDRGIVRTYKWNGSSNKWDQDTTPLQGEVNSDYFGRSVSLSEDGLYLAASANQNDDNGGNSGAVYLYKRSTNGNEWINTEKINGKSYGDQFGSSISLSGNGLKLLVGAPFSFMHDDVNDTFHRGILNVYAAQNMSKVTSNLLIKSQTDISNSLTVFQDASFHTHLHGFDASFNNNLEISNNLIIPNKMELKDKLVVFKDASFNQHISCVDASFQINVEVSGNLMVRGETTTTKINFSDGTSQLTATNNATNMFSKGTFLHSTDTTWSPRGEILGKDSYDYFGWSVSVNGDGTIIAAAAPNNSDGHSSAGAIRIYKWNDVDLSWNKMGSDIYGETANEQSGGSGAFTDVTQHPISLNKAGSIVAIGSYLNDVNGSNRGLVRMFKWNDTSWNQLGQNIYGEANEDQSGHSVRMNGIGDIVIIGAIYNDGGGVNSGHARIYQYNDVSWNQIGQDIDGDSNGDNLGWSTSINETGSIIAVSAIYNDAGGSNSGNVRVYEYNDTSWNKLGQDIYGDGAGDESGYSVSLNGSGKIVAIGARYNDGGGSNSGHALVYEYNDVSWNQIGQNINGKYTNEYLGWCISIDSTGSILAIGEGDSSLDGMIVIYNWNQTTELWDFNERLYSYQSDDRFGRSVALSSDGTTLIAGAPYFISNGHYKGLVRMYHRPNKPTEDSFHINAPTDISGMLNVKGSFKVDISGGGLENTYNPSKLVEATTATNILFWKQKGNTVIGKLNGTSGSQYWGRYEHSIAMNETGDTFVVGNHENDEGTSGNNAGITQIYRWNDVSWNQIGQNIYGEANDDQSGWATTINGEGNIVVIGARYNDDGGSSSGHVRVYQYNDVSWNKMGLDIHGESNDDRFGYSVSINKKGNIIAAGGYLDDGGTGGGSNHGHVRIYEWDESNETWNQLGDSISGYKNHDEMGRSVSLNTDGTIVAIQHRANQTASDRGRITAYKWDGTTWNQLGDNTQMTNINNSNQGVYGSSDILKTVISGDGTIIVVGSEFNDGVGTDRGIVRTYKWNGSSNTWDQDSTPLEGEVNSDYFGRSVSLSEDGMYLAASANLNDDNGSNSGAVYLYKRSTNGNEWINTEKINGKSHGDQFGSSISLSGNGLKLLVGAPFSFMHDDVNDTFHRGILNVYAAQNMSKVTSNLLIKSQTDISNSLTVFQDASFQNNVDITNDLFVGNDVSINNHLSCVDASFQGNVAVAGDISATNVDISGSLVVGGDSIYKLDFGYAQMNNPLSQFNVLAGDPSVTNPNQYYGCIFGLNVDITPNRSGAKVLLNYNINGEWNSGSWDKLTYIAVGIVDPNTNACSYDRSLRATVSGGSRRGISGFMTAYHVDYNSTQESSIGQFIDDDSSLNPNIKYRYTPVLVNTSNSGTQAFVINQTWYGNQVNAQGAGNEMCCSSMVAQILGYT